MYLHTAEMKGGPLQSLTLTNRSVAKMLLKILG